MRAPVYPSIASDLLDCHPDAAFGTGAAEGESVEPCRFVTSWGGVVHCIQPAHRHGFCSFHYDCFRNGEITERGLISEALTDQERRRKINFYGLPSEHERPA